MVISPTVFTPCEAAEAIQVKLSLEGRELGLAEVLGHDNRDKLLGLVHEKGTPVRLPDRRLQFYPTFRVAFEERKLRPLHDACRLNLQLRRHLQQSPRHQGRDHDSCELRNGGRSV